MPLVSAIQMTSGPDVSANLRDARALLEEAAGQGGDASVVSLLAELGGVTFVAKVKP